MRYTVSLQLASCLQGQIQKILVGGYSFEFGKTLTECKYVKPGKGQTLFRKCVHVRGVYLELLAPIFNTKRIFSGKVKFEANKETKMILVGVGGMFSRKIFKNLHAAIGILFIKSIVKIG